MMTTRIQRRLKFSVVFPVFAFLMFLGAASRTDGQTCQVSLFVETEGAESLPKPTVSAVNRITTRAYRPVFLKNSFLFKNLPMGSYSLSFKKGGYVTLIADVEIDCGRGLDRQVHTSVVMCAGNRASVYQYGSLTLYGRRDKFTVAGTTFICDARREKGAARIPSRDPNRYTIKGNNDFSSPKRTISGGVLNGKANSLPKPPYPPAARAVRASGAVSVQVLIDEVGNVVSANAVSGHPLLRSAAVEAARAAKFSPIFLAGVPVKVSGIITYNFVP